ncbi:MAG: FMN-binding protein [Tissierellaceae bacterium]|jgi:Na+-transporting NADH:ubiquinone oxidoreductase subunit C|nr:FMN-binding protein [Bacillota bacterium]NLI65906.1 FMN-binding protein [Tissierellia bacterium]
MKKKSFVYPIIFVAVITALYTFVLAYLNHSTAEKIEFLQDTELRRKILNVFDIPIASDDPDVIESVFNEHIHVDIASDPPIFYTTENGEIRGYAIPASGPGLWGKIDAYVGVSADYSKVFGLEFIAHSETPGLGGRISEPDFLEQFRDVDISNPVDNMYIIYRPAPGGNIDSISGATQTSKAVSDLLNAEIHEFIMGKGDD